MTTEEQILKEQQMIGMLIDCMKTMSDRIKDLEVRCGILETKYAQTLCFITNTVVLDIAELKQQRDDGK